MTAYDDYMAGLLGGLGAYYPHAEPSGTTMEDLSGANRDGSYAGAVTLGVPGPTRFDTDTAITVTNATTDHGIVTSAAWMNRTTDIAFGTWVKTTQAGTGYIMGRYGAANLWAADFQSSNVVRVYANIAASTRTSQATVTGLRNGLWHLIGGEYDGANFKLYVDGLEAANTAITGALATGVNDLTIGTRQAGLSDSFAGSLARSFMGPAIGPAAWAKMWEQGPPATLDGASRTSITVANLGSLNIVCARPIGAETRSTEKYIIASATWNNNGTITPPTDVGAGVWHAAPLGISSGGVHKWWKKCTASEPSTYTFVRSATANNVVMQMAVVDYADLNVNPDQFSASNRVITTNVPITGFTAGANAKLLVSMAEALANNAYVQPTGMTLDYDITSAPSNFRAAAAHEAIAGGAVIDTKTWNTTGAADKSAGMWTFNDRILPAVPEGSGSIEYNYVMTATGETVPEGTATLGYDFTVSATGEAPPPIPPDPFEADLIGGIVRRGTRAGHRSRR